MRKRYEANNINVVVDVNNANEVNSVVSVVHNVNDNVRMRVQCAQTCTQCEWGCVMMRNIGKHVNSNVHDCNDVFACVSPSVL